MKNQSDEIEFNQWVSTLEILVLDLCETIYKCDSSNRSDIQYYFADTFMKMISLDDESKVELVPKLQKAPGLSEIKVIISKRVVDIKIKELEDEIRKSKSQNVFQKIFKITKQFFSFYCISDLKLSDLDSDPEVLRQELQYLLKEKEMHELYLYYNTS